MILRDFTNGIVLLADQHGWFTSNINFERNPDVVLITLSRDVKDGEIAMAIRVDCSTISAVVLGGSRPSSAPSLRW